MITGSRQFSGKKVVSQDGHIVGEVLGLETDTDTWKVVALEVKLERGVLEMMSLKKPVFGTHSVKLAVDSVSGVSDSVVLKTDAKHIHPIESEAAALGEGGPSGEPNTGHAR